MTVLNMRDLRGQQVDLATQIYIGRPWGSVATEHFGNPFTHKTGTKALIILPTGEEAVQAFDDWLEGTKWQEVEPKRRLWILSHLYLLKDKDPVCWCKPKACHGDILERRVKELS